MAALRRGWYLGEDRFRDRLLDLLYPHKARKRVPSSHAGEAIRDFGRKEAEDFIGKIGSDTCLPSLALELANLPNGDPRKVICAALIKSRTSITNEWLATRLGMGHPTSMSRHVHRLPRTPAGSKILKKHEKSLNQRTAPFHPFNSGHQNGLIAAVSKRLLAGTVLCLLIVGSNACDGDKKESHGASQAEYPGTRPRDTSSRGSGPVTVQSRSRLLKRSSSGGLSYDSMQMLKDLAVSNPSVALEAYTRDPKGMNYEGFPEIAALIAKHHPEFISKWLDDDLYLQIEDSNDREAFVSFLLPALAVKDSTAALDALEGLGKNGFGNPEVMERLKDGMFSRMGATDSADAVRQVTARYNGEQLNAALVAVARGTGAEDIESALEIVDKISSPQEKSKGMALILGESGFRDYARIAPAVSKMEGAAIMKLLQEDETGMFSEVLYKSDLESVKRALDTAVLTEKSSSCFGRYVNTQIAKNPLTALDFVLSFPVSPLRDRMLMPAFAMWGRKDPDAAFGKVLEMDGNAKNEALRGIAGALGEKGMDAIIAASAKLDKDSRARFIADSIGQASKVDLEGSLEYVNSSQFMKDTEIVGTRSTVINTVSQQYTAKDPAAAFQWIATLGKESQAQAMLAYATQRARTDLPSLAEQLGSMPKDDNWRVGVGVLISKLRNSDPARAVQWEQALKSN